MRIRFTLSHTGLLQSTQASLPSYTTWQNVGSGTDWTLVGDPTVSITGTGTSKFLATPLKPVIGQNYAVVYQVDMLVNGGGSYTGKIGFIKDGAFVGTPVTVGSSSGTHSGTANLSVETDADYLGFQLTGSGSFSVLTVEAASMSNFPVLTEVSTELEISEPDGWKQCALRLERHEDFHSLVEYFEGGANGAFIFYGNNGTENGGYDYIKDIERTYGVDETIRLLIEIDPEDNDDYETLFAGILDMSSIVELPKNKLQVGVLADNIWSRFIARMNIPVNVMSTTDLDGNTVEVFDNITVNLPPQKLRQQYEGSSSSAGSTSENLSVIVSGTYYQMSFDEIQLKEINEIFILPQSTNTELPAEWMITEYAGTYTFDIQTVAFDYNPPYNFVGQDISDYIQFYINIDGVETAFTVGGPITSLNIDGGRIYTLNHTATLNANSSVRVYGKAIANLTESGGGYSGEIRWNGRVINADQGDIECYARVTAHTEYPETSCEAFLAHDLAYQILDRYNLYGR